MLELILRQYNHTAYFLINAAFMTFSTIANVKSGLSMPTWDGLGLPLQFIKFDAARFDLDAYAHHSIVCPPSVARSVVKRQAEYFFGRMAARNALAAFGLGHSEVGTRASHAPAWPLGIMGSISHNEKYAVAVAVQAAVNGGIGLGIDVESIAKAASLDALKNTVLSPQEFEYLCKLDTQLPLATLMTIVFSAKESFFKAGFNSVGRFFDFDAIELREMDLRARAMKFVIREPLARALPVGAIRTVNYR